MSGITGIYHLDGRPVARMSLDRMVESLVHRGGDGAGAWIEGAVGLGHRMLWTTPESIGERLPLVSRDSGLAITADARIDNRDELIGLLGLGLEQIGDSRLILTAYEKWGENCATYLLGDFAFAIWDSRKRALFCCRDHFGVKPFYYYLSESLFAFATEIKTLVELPEVPCLLNETMLAEHLSGAFSDRQITFYQGILRLPPGHTLTVCKEFTQTRSYWSLDASREIKLGSNDEYAEAFRELFAKAVNCRLRSAFPIGSMLSGGLDSSSITVMAQSLSGEKDGPRLRTFSAVFDEIKQCDEREYINTVLAKNVFDHHYVRGDEFGPLTDLDRVLWHEDKPVFAPNIFLHWELYRAASAQGTRVLLDGFDGDSVVSQGYQYLNELAESGRWITLTSQTVALFRNLGVSPWRPLMKYFLHFGLNPIIRKSWFLRGLRRVARAFGRGRSSSDQQFTWTAFINPSFVERMHLAEHYKRWRKAQPMSARSEREGHYRTLTQESLPLAFEIYDSAAAAFSVEARYPFWDKRLVEFCLALPPEQKLNRGLGRNCMRRAMKGILPEQVRLRSSKTDFLPVFQHGLLSFERTRLDDLVQGDLDDLKPYINVTAVREFHRRLINGSNPALIKEVLAFWRVISLALWLRYAWSIQKRQKEVMKM